MTYNFTNKNRNEGFSLIELIVVIAIMAVLVVFVVPSLLAYVEKSRAEKDNSAMDELTNSITLALSDQNIYDEVLCYAAYNNVSCYIDQNAENESGYTKTTTKAEVDLGGKGKSGPQYIYGDETRLADETPYYAAGNMRGVTITFKGETGGATKKAIFDLGNGEINKFASGGLTARSVTLTYGGSTPNSNAMTLRTMKAFDSSESYLYNRVRSTVGDKIEITSQTYRNSEYTVFIHIGTTGGHETAHQDAIQVYGQWSGTNLSAG